jgi:hypothetical protein
MSYLNLDILYVNGTKLESRTNRNTFVWRKTVEKNKAKQNPINRPLPTFWIRNARNGFCYLRYCI